jgi:PhnB protein
MQFIAYLDFDGQCRDAFDFYARVFRGEVTRRMTWGESPMAAQTPPAAHGRILHSQLDSGGGVLMGADAPPGTAVHRGCVNVQVDDPAEAERVFAELSDGATIQMPLQATFWAQRFGMLVDRYGKGWMVNCAATGAPA